MSTVAFSHDWLNGMRGGEKCLEALCELFPKAPIYTLFCEPSKLSNALRAHPIHSSWLGRFPSIRAHYRLLLPLFPMAVGSLGTKSYELVISMSHCVAKSPPKGPKALHICYCFTPMRYAWGFFEEYFGEKNSAQKLLISALMSGIRQWDLKTSRQVDHFVAISEHVRKRILTSYGRDAEVIYPPVDTDYFTPDDLVSRDDYYVLASALVPYKRADLAIQAFNQNGRRLVVIGEGPERQRLEKLAGPRIHFLGWQPDKVLRDHYRRARALIFPGEEDFGIVPLEMQACGGAVLAYGRGGALETIQNRKTGLFFDSLTPEALNRAVTDFEALSWEPSVARQNALAYSRDRFKEEMMRMIDREKKKRGLL